MAELIPTATSEKNGLLDKSYALQTVIIQPNNNYELARAYSLVCIKETSLTGLGVVLFTLWSEVGIIFNDSVNDSVLTFKSNNHGGLIITNIGNKTVTLTMRVII